MPGQGLPNTPRRRVQPKPGPAFGRSLVQQVGGLLMLLLVVVPGYVMSRPIPDEVAQAAKANQSGRAVTTAMIGEHIREIAPRYGVSEVLVASIIAVESEYNPRAVSRKGARGLMQLMPATASSLRVDDPFDPRENIEAGVRHLRRLMDLFDNNLPLVIAAYNAGENAVRRYRGIPPYRETRQYVSRVLRKVRRAQPDSVPAYQEPTRLKPRKDRRTSSDARSALLIIPAVYQPGSAPRTR
ncbi:MAG TPA: lytic transglycosylase domain-containing protein [Methylomirabilota bacterium]|nr:lytic transglycosylase domain-containing protein [Methylomirabilota bacterium]